jgi:5'-3' exonuclease
MGIPSYFSYIIKNHSNIIKPLNNYDIHVTHFYLDCNSIIYDVIKTLEKTENIYNNKIIIQNVISQICIYIKRISPTKLIYIAFDGVAPIAKLEQQRQRRFKSYYQKQIMKSIHKTKNDTWDTCQITPGTQFMNELNYETNKYFENHNLFNVEQIIVSTSNEVGEGEHKIFEYIRRLPFQEKNINVIYGLDADLIMLCVNHLYIGNPIYLYRETPEFIKSIQEDLEPNQDYLMDILLLSESISLNMDHYSVNHSTNRLNDYIFICFLLGNDFMPHFPSVNIRTNGIEKILDAYKNTIGNTNKTITDGKNIIWDNFFIFIKWLATNEDTFFKEEYKLRNRREKSFSNIKEEWKKIELLPNYNREIEKFINPEEEGWQSRYYQTLFSEKDISTIVDKKYENIVDKKYENIVDKKYENIVENYLEGLLWNVKYYSEGCIDWTWKYNYHYPPLLCDILKYGKRSIHKIQFNTNTKAVNELTQLCYVVPNSSLHIIPSQIRKRLMKYPHLYPDDCVFMWAFCKYFWESHVMLPEIDISFIEKIIS